MGFLVDTNVISEPSRANPNTSVLRWIAETEERYLFVSALTFGELSRGVSLLPVSKKRERCQRFLALLGERYADADHRLDARGNCVDAWPYHGNPQCRRLSARWCPARQSFHLMLPY